MVVLRIKYNHETSKLVFQNTSNVPMDSMVFIFYSDEFVVDVDTGIVTK